MDIEKKIDELPSQVKGTIIIAMIFLALWMFISSYKHSAARNVNSRYTIGYVTGTDYVVGPSSHSVAFFTYSVGDSTYRSSADGDLAEGCTRCLVKFAAADPINKEFFNKICVPDSIAKPPPLGWTKPPFPVPE